MFGFCAPNAITPVKALFASPVELKSNLRLSLIVSFTTNQVREFVAPDTTSLKNAVVLLDSVILSSLYVPSILSETYFLIVSFTSSVFTDASSLHFPPGYSINATFLWSPFTFTLNCTWYLSPGRNWPSVITTFQVSLVVLFESFSTVWFVVYLYADEFPFPLRKTPVKALLRRSEEST